MPAILILLSTSYDGSPAKHYGSRAAAKRYRPTTAKQHGGAAVGYSSADTATPDIAIIPASPAAPRTGHDALGRDHHLTAASVSRCLMDNLAKWGCSPNRRF
jgi:hypothetical protein